MIPFPDIDPIALRLGPVAVHWYGIAYVAGFFTGLAYLKHILKRYGEHVVSLKHADDAFMWIIIGIILGGRLGYILFYNFAYYIEHPTAILKTWQGGMSFHGGLIGVILATLLFTYVRKLNYFDLADRMAPAFCFGLFFGRIANFINGELYGRATDMPWGIIFPNGGNFARHPSQLYEALLEGVVLFVILHLVLRRRVRRYEASGIFMLGYGLARFFVEFFRQPDNIPHLQDGIFTFITMGQILCIPMIGIGLGLLALSRRKGTPVEYPPTA